MSVVGLIPARLNSQRLYGKALIEIAGVPIVVHTYKQAIKSRKLDDLYICTDSKKIYSTALKFGCKVLLTKKHLTGTDRISEAASLLNRNFHYYVDVQGDEPFINPNHIDKLIEWHMKNNEFDIVVPSMKMTSRFDDPNIVKVVSSKNRIIYFTRSKSPYPFKKNTAYFKHLSIISFKPKALKKFHTLPQSNLEKIESIELMRALENNFKMGTFYLNGNSFSIDTIHDLNRAKIKVQNISNK